MIPVSPLEDPHRAQFAWARYRRLMKFMAAVTLAVMIGSMWLLYRMDGYFSIHFFIATGLGIGAAMMLMAARMGLVFLSSGSGHDEAIVDPLEDERV